jgi:hypothetical protein
MMAVNFANPTFGISVGEAGTEIYSIDGGATWNTGTMNLSSTKKSETGITLKQNYPNPFNPSTVINYTLPFDSKVSVKVFDITGREIAQLVNNFENTGNHSVTFNASGLSSGVYFYTITAQTGSQEFKKTMKMILTK